MDKEVKLRQAAVIAQPDQVVLEPGELNAVLEVTLKRPDGTIKEQWVRKSESFVRQFIDLLTVQMGLVWEGSPLSIRDVTNNLIDVALSHYNFAADALVSDDSYSIVVGTGSTAPAIDDHALGAKTANGAGAGQLQYSLTAFGLPTAGADQSHFTITRDFSNVSGAAITVNEIGLCVKGQQACPFKADVSRPVAIFMVIRDVIAGGIAIGNGETLTINYRLVAQV